MSFSYCKKCGKANGALNTTVFVCACPVPKAHPMSNYLPRHYDTPPTIEELGVGDVAYGLAQRAINEKWSAERLGPEIAKFALLFLDEFKKKVVDAVENL